MARGQGLPSRPIRPAAAEVAAQAAEGPADPETVDALGLEGEATGQALDSEECGDDYYDNPNEMDLYDDYVADAPADDQAPVVDQDGFTESDEGDYPLPGWHTLTPDEQDMARELFRKFLARGESVSRQ